MDLTYNVTENGYIILNNGVAWIKQEGFIPPEFQADSFAESAEKHIAYLIEQAEKSKQTELEQEENKIILERLDKENIELKQAIAEITMMIATP